MDHQTKPHESVIKAKENMETATEVSWLDLKTFAVWSVSTARIYGCRNVAKPAPVLWARQVSRLFDVVIVGPHVGRQNYRLSIVYRSAMRSMASRGLNLPEYVTATNPAASLHRLCIANTLVECGEIQPSSCEMLLGQQQAIRFLFNDQLKAYASIVATVVRILFRVPMM
jgi:hypothetical protein